MGLRLVVIGVDVVDETRTLFFVVDSVAFVGLVLSVTFVVGLCRFVGLAVVVVGRLLGAFVLIIVGELTVVVTVSCTD